MAVPLVGFPGVLGWFKLPIALNVPHCRCVPSTSPRGQDTRAIEFASDP